MQYKNLVGHRDIAPHSVLWEQFHKLIIHRVQKKSNIFIFTIYFSQFLGKFYETFSEYP